MSALPPQPAAHGCVPHFDSNPALHTLIFVLLIDVPSGTMNTTGCVFLARTRARFLTRLRSARGASSDSRRRVRPRLREIGEQASLLSLVPPCVAAPREARVGLLAGDWRAGENAWRSEVATAGGNTRRREDTTLPLLILANALASDSGESGIVAPVSGASLCRVRCGGVDGLARSLLADWCRHSVSTGPFGINTMAWPTFMQ